jgi:hypothetical protein
MVKNSQIHDRNNICGRTKSRLAELVLVAASPITKIAAAPQWRNVAPILVFFGLCLVLVPFTALAKTHRVFEWQRSLILPPPNEPPPPPPPSGDLLIHDADNSARSAPRVRLWKSITEVNYYGNVLVLPRSRFLQRQRLLAVGREYNANDRLNQERRRGEYSEEDVDEDWPPQDEPPTDYETQLKPPMADGTPSDTLHGGFIPLNPRGITVRPGERITIPPTSPLLTPPPGSAAMPYVWGP